MNTIQATARSLIAEEGSICAIIELLEDPEDARYNLKPEIEALKKSAKKCLDNAQSITSKFAYWHFVIMHLKKDSLDGIGRPSHPILVLVLSVIADCSLWQMIRLKRSGVSPPRKPVPSKMQRCIKDRKGL